MIWLEFGLGGFAQWRSLFLSLERKYLLVYPAENLEGTVKLSFSQILVHSNSFL